MTISIRKAVLTAGAVALLGLAAIGLVQAASSAGGAPARPLAAAAVAAVPDTNTAATTGGADVALTGELDAILAADQTAAGRAGGPRADADARILRRLRIARTLVHATIVLDLPKAGLTTVQVDHGTISTVGATTLTVGEKDGTKATVTLGDETRVRRNGVKAKIADLKTGDEVFVMSKIESGGTVAYLVIVPKN
ncbi:MAG TPA: hypothetical protein VFY18_11985 [Candidatus Limnocylindrales bacterium]|nr:hypothetical protein [Candidatus Limnocylindrales bacterium]